MAVSLLPYMAAFPGPGGNAKAAMLILAATAAALLCTAAVRSATSGHTHERKTFLLCTHQTFLFVLLYLLIGGFGVLFLSMVNVIAGWSIIGAPVPTSCFSGDRFRRGTLQQGTGRAWANSGHTDYLPARRGTRN